jgi:hypothetical protein
MDKIIHEQVAATKNMPFQQGNELFKYFEMLPDQSELSKKFKHMCSLPTGAEKEQLQQELKECVTAGSIDVNIMAKVDNLNYSDDGTPLSVEYSDALSALRGFANSQLSSSLVLSAGYNPRLYNYISSFADFFPNEAGRQKKKIILKVSDYRSALIQGKLLAKKGIWISEFRIESGLNCGGHAFATDGFLLGPILEEFKEKRNSLTSELFNLCNQALINDGRNAYSETPTQRITAQGGIGTANEDRFLREYYHLDGTGWGSPFLLVPEATNVDERTLNDLGKSTRLLPEPRFTTWCAIS